MLFPGDVLGRYVIERHIGGGGFGEVYAARLQAHAGIERRVALKVMRETAGRHARGLLDEARVLARLHHPGIVSAVDVDEHDGVVFIAMELLIGAPLDRVQRASPLPLAACVEVVRRAALALHHAHTQEDEALGPLGIVHRDVSPSNLFLTSEGDVKVIDFGIARSRVQELHTREGLVRGKVGYMSPEQARGDVVGAASDVFALGVVLYELLAAEATGSHAPLFRGENDLQTLLLVQAAVVPPLPTAPAALVAVARAALQRDIAERLPSAAALEQALADAVVQLGLPEGRELVLDAMSERSAALSDVDDAAVAGRTAARTRPVSSPMKPLVEQSALAIDAPPSNVSQPQPIVSPSSTSPVRVGFVVAALLLVGSIVVVERQGPTTQTPAPQAVAPPPPPLPLPSPAPQPTSTTVAPPSSPSARTPARTPTRTSVPTPTPTSTSSVAAQDPPKLGSLTVPLDDPFVLVDVDGVRVGPSPVVRHPLPAGRHRVTLRDPQSEAVLREREVDIEGNVEARVR